MTATFSHQINIQISTLAELMMQFGEHNGKFPDGNGFIMCVCADCEIVRTQIVTTHVFNHLNHAKDVHNKFMETFQGEGQEIVETLLGYLEKIKTAAERADGEGKGGERLENPSKTE